MNAKQALALVALAFAGTAAMADDITIANDHSVSLKTRAELRAEVIQARQNGTMPQYGEVDAAAPAAAKSALTREQVRAELRNARGMKRAPSEVEAA